MRRMTVVAGNPGQLVLATPELKLLGCLLVTGETDLRPSLGRFIVEGHQASHPLAATSSHVGFSRAMAGLTPPVRCGLLGGLLEESGMGSGPKILRQIG